MSIQVTLLVIDRRRVSVMSTLFSKEFMSFDVPKEFGVPDEIGDMTRSLEMVPSDSGIFWSTRELREFAGEYMGLIGPYRNRGERPKGRRRAPPLRSELD